MCDVMMLHELKCPHLQDCELPCFITHPAWGVL
jgi:hypothetical protein